jgi:hypothetical protein
VAISFTSSFNSQDAHAERLCFTGLQPLLAGCTNPTMVYLLSALPCEDCLSFLLKTATQANVVLIANLTGARPHLFLARCGAKSSGQLSLTTGSTTRTLSAAWEHQELGELAVVGPPVETRPVRLEARASQRGACVSTRGCFAPSAWRRKAKHGTPAKQGVGMRGLGKGPK